MTQRTQVDRRRALGLGVAGAAATVLGASQSEAAGKTGGRAVDVVIVGAGFAGLTAASKLRAQGASVVVLEADDRVGGRTKPGQIAGHVVDLGGQWVGPTQARLLALAAEFGVKTTPQYAEGDNIIDIAGRRQRYSGEIPMLDTADLVEFGRLMAIIDGTARKVGAAAPWTAPEAAVLDAQTVESWLLSQTSSEPARVLYRLLTRAVFSVEASQISLLYFMTYAAAAGGLEPLIGTRGGAQDATFEGGVWQLAAKMAARLGERVVTGAPVERIAQTPDGVIVETGAGVWRAKYVIVTAPPAMAARIAYAPPLPARRDGLSQRMPLGCVIKVHVAYERPFWRAEGLSGLILSDRIDSGPWFDKSASGKGPGGMVGFFDGGPAQVWSDRPAAERREQVLKDLAVYLGPQALKPIDYVEEVWSTAEWHRGGYVSVPGPGTLTAFGQALREPVARIHWAGTETADVWLGYIDGAIGSGERAASEVQARLHAG